MAMQHIERVLRQLGEADLAEDIALRRKQFADRGHGSDIPLPQETSPVSTRRETPRLETPTVYPEIPLEAEWQRQSQNFLELRFHVETGFEDTVEGKQAYLDSLPKFEPQPEEYRERFNVPLLVETRIPWEKQTQLAGIVISDYLTSRINETKPYDARSQTPETPYTGWFNSWGERFTKKIAPTDARKQLTSDEIGGGLYEGVAIQVAHPEITGSGKYFDLIGYNVESGHIPYLRRWLGGSWLAADWRDSASDDFRPLVRGSKIVTG